MNLDIINNILNNAKESDLVQNLINELSKYIENVGNKMAEKANCLKEDDALYQVVEMATDGAYLQNVNNNKVSKETDLSKDLLNKIGEDTILRYKDGEYLVEEEMTQKFFDSLVSVKEYKEIQENFVGETNISEIDSNTKFEVQSIGSSYTTLIYGDDSTIDVPNELIPFFTTTDSVLSYKGGKFERI